MPLNDTFIKTLKPSTKAKKYADGQGLFLFVNTNGTKSWRFRYRDISGKEKEMTFGTYPEISLSEAREKRLEQRKLVVNGKDPISEKKIKIHTARIEAGNTFEAVAKEWHDLNRVKWTASHAETILNRLKNHVFPVIGNLKIQEIGALDVLNGVIRHIEKDGKTETSHRILQYCSSIFRFAVITQRIPYNPLADLRGVLKPHKTVNRPTLAIEELPEFLIKLEELKHNEIDKLALRLLLLTFVRPRELRRTKWKYFDLQNKIWKIPAEDMKMGLEHWVPLSNQAVSVIERIHKISGGNDYLFPSKNFLKYPYMNENTMNKLIHKLEYKKRLVGHGFRSLASTTLNELGYNPDVIERQLAHVESNKVRAAYNRAKYLPHRAELMQAWADHIDKVVAESKEKKNGKIIFGAGTSIIHSANVIQAA